DTYLTCRAAARRLVFIGVALLVPIVANWLRAYMIVMIGHLSGNKLAVGVDHLIYGWVFFGVVILLMFAIGSRWAEAPANENAATEAVHGAAGGRAAPAAMLWAVVATAGVLSALPQYAARLADDAVQTTAPHLAAVPAAHGWASLEAGEDEWRPSFVEPAAELQRRYVSAGGEVGLYLAYYRQQDYQRKLVSSQNVLARSNDRRYAVAATGVGTVQTDG